MEEATEEADEYLKLMEMKQKSNEYGENLSGGMKRKLCLSIALMGKAEVSLVETECSPVWDFAGYLLWVCLWLLFRY